MNSNYCANIWWNINIKSFTVTCKFWTWSIETSSMSESGNVSVKRNRKVIKPLCSTLISFLKKFFRVLGCQNQIIIIMNHQNTGIYKTITSCIVLPRDFSKSNMAPAVLVLVLLVILFLLGQSMQFKPDSLCSVWSKKPNFDPSVNNWPKSKLAFPAKLVETLVAEQLTGFQESDDLLVRFQRPTC